jgi:ATP-dependent Lon protease
LLVEKANELDGLIGVFFVGEYRKKLSERIGVLAVIDDIGIREISDLDEPEGHEVNFTLTGIYRFRVIRFLKFMKVEEGQSYPVEAEIEIIREQETTVFELIKSGQLTSWTECYKNLLNKTTNLPPSSVIELTTLPVGVAADMLIGYLPTVEHGEESARDEAVVRRMPLNDKLEFLNIVDPLRRFCRAVDYLKKFFAPLFNEDNLYYSENQCKDLIPSPPKSSLGADQEREIDKLTKGYQKIRERLSLKIQRAIDEEFEKLRRMSQGDVDYSKTREYLEFAISLFSLKPDEVSKNLVEIRSALNDNHYGLEQVKKRIIEYVAVRMLNPKIKAPILCFVGPPGVGKTSLGQSIARALGLKFYRMSLGGVSDAPHICGHRRTYIGAVPGMILTGIKQCGASNPVFMIDEIDKIGHESLQGDVKAALLEVLDPEQNHSFTDHYLDLPFDLSGVFFITTANVTHTIPDALRDRMEILHLPGYTEEEKIKIAREFLIPRQLRENGLAGKLAVNFTAAALARIVRDYTQEVGVRNLERNLASICRQLGTDYLEGKISRKKFCVSVPTLRKFLGSRKYFPEKLIEEVPPGLAIGLAVSEYGGHLLFVESKSLPGSGSLKLTGSLGKVLRESARVAMSLLRSRIHSEVERKIKDDIHIHLPQGAISKDGPSAGIAIVCSLYSLFKNRPVKTKLALTGEIDILGRVLCVGGVREKLVAAVHAGIKEIIIPKGNEEDLDDLTPEIKRRIKRKELVIHTVSTVDEALNIAFPERALVK